MAARIVVIRVDLDRLQTFFTIGAILGFALVVIAQVGESLHGWNDFGEFATLFGTVTGLLLGALAALVSATKGQVRDVANGVRAGNTKLDSATTKLDSANSKLEENNALLRQVVARFDRHEAIMERQALLLQDIRDGLAA
ncbi:MAG TPA: hypothetical protein VGR28_07450 [Candidatus Thermoplasmatota archaeon]|jgi:hypothetical protein|nr:hypothetical protein [Candidatus Thermoplasmatota archaeon]